MATEPDRRLPGLAWAEGGSYPALLVSHGRELWTVAILTYVVGDLVTTFVGVRYTGLVEGSPLPAALLAEFGFGALVGLKAVSVVPFVLLWRVVPGPASAGVPLGLLLVGSTVTLWNTLLVVLVSI